MDLKKCQTYREVGTERLGFHEVAGLPGKRVTRFFCLFAGKERGQETPVKVHVGLSEFLKSKSSKSVLGEIKD